ncbi:MAG: RNA polymerase sigma factor [Planctomycetes bacterium]|nr:RNA polymerase sigma factor [Planctomycetota bacterium]
MPGSVLGSDEFVAAFTRHGRALWVIASAWVGRGDAADLVQEAARVAWERRQQFEPGTQERAWLAQIVRNVGANWRRQRRPEPRPDEQFADVAARAAPAPAWPFDADRHGLSDELARALGALPEVARACLLLQVVLGHSFAEIATMLEIPENTASSHARRARLQLRAALEANEPARAPAPETP